MNFASYVRNIKRNMNGWVALGILGAAVVLLPNFFILANLFRPVNENWQHIKQYMLADYVFQSLQLVLFTGTVTVFIGVALAWLVTAYDFPFRRFFRWAFVLPLAIPPYIAAYTYSSMLSYTGFVQTFMRNQLGIMPDQRFFDIMSMKGAIFIFSMFLFPYVYLITKTFLERQSASYIENARLLGNGPFRVFFRIVLPLAQPAVVGGVSLVIFEVLNDYGVTSYFGIQTFTTAIFQTWFGMYDVESAIRLAALLMSGIIGLFIIERLLRSRRRFSSPTSKTRPIVLKRLCGIHAWIAVACGFVIIAFSFMIPFLQLVVWAYWTVDDILNPKFLKLIYNTLSVSLLAAGIVVLLSMVVANVCRLRRSVFNQVLSRLISMGYSIPGAVISIGVLAVFIWLDDRLAGIYQWLGYDAATLLLSLSPVMLIVAYMIRFMAIGYNPIEAGFEKIGNGYTEASRLLGYGITRTFYKIDLPMIKGAMLTGFLLTFMEIVKELPLTLLLRPFNFETLATKTYQYANDEQIIEAAVPSLLIIAISMVSVYFYHRSGEKIES